MLQLNPECTNFDVTVSTTIAKLTELGWNLEEYWMPEDGNIGSWDRDELIKQVDDNYTTHLHLVTTGDHNVVWYYIVNDETNDSSISQPAEGQSSPSPVRDDEDSINDIITLLQNGDAQIVDDCSDCHSYNCHSFKLLEEVLVDIEQGLVTYQNETCSFAEAGLAPIGIECKDVDEVEEHLLDRHQIEGFYPIIRFKLEDN